MEVDQADVWSTRIRPEMVLYHISGVAKVELCGDQVFEEDIMKPFTQKFKFGAMHEGDFKCFCLEY